MRSRFRFISTLSYLSLCPFGYTLRRGSVPESPLGPEVHWHAVDTDLPRSLLSVTVGQNERIDDMTRDTFIVTLAKPEVSARYRLGNVRSVTADFNEGICDYTARVRSVILGQLVCHRLFHCD